METIWLRDALTCPVLPTDARLRFRAQCGLCAQSKVQLFQTMSSLVDVQTDDFIGGIRQTYSDREGVGDLGDARANVEIIGASRALATEAARATVLDGSSSVPADHSVEGDKTVNVVL